MDFLRSEHQELLQYYDRESADNSLTRHLLEEQNRNERIF